MNGEEVIDRRVLLSLSPSGGIALAAYSGGVGECIVYYDNVVVTALDGANANCDVFGMPRPR